MTLSAGGRFRPSLWPTLFTVPALLVLVALGTWQLDRLAWKRDLLAEIDARVSAQPLRIGTGADAIDPSAEDLDGLAYRRAVARGRFLHDREMHLAARTFDGQVGYHVVTPLDLAEGGVLLVDRGWVPHERRDPATRPEGQVPGIVEVEGVLRIPPERGWLQPENRPEEDAWFRVDPAAMAARAGLGEVMPVVLEAGPAVNPGGLPVGGRTRLEFPNDHLQYAITWYGLAVVLAVVYVVYHWRRDPD